MTGELALMHVGGRLVPHLVAGLATEELLNSWALYSVPNRGLAWYVLLNLETCVIDVWPEVEVRNGVGRSL